MRIAKETGTSFVKSSQTTYRILTTNRLKVWEEALTVFDEHGTTMSKEEINELSSLEWEDVIAAASQYSKENHETIDSSVSLYDFFLQRTEKMFQNQTPAIAEQKRSKLLQMAQGWGAYIGSPIHRQSLKYFWLEECLEGENPFVAGTYSKILQAVAKPARTNANIRLGCEIVEIHSNPKPCVKLANGDVLSFDEVVVTTPLGWLKENKGAFEPPLPSKMSLAIDSISYGHLDKVYITFPSAWWSATTSQTDGSPHVKDNDVSTQLSMP